MHRLGNSELFSADVGAALDELNAMTPQQLAELDRHIWRH